jgi:peroxiredoxin Q/BCP
MIQGQVAPDITLHCTAGESLLLSSLRPSMTVLFAYGADGTPSCTNEIMDFNTQIDAFTDLGCVVIGLSKDTVKKHTSFMLKTGVRYRLASDFQGAVMESIGAYGEKIFFGKNVIGVLRTTFLIDGDGIVQKIWKVDKVKGHAEEVLNFVKTLKSEP